MTELIFRLLCGHALADFALQTDAMAKGKNRNRKPDYIPAGQKYTPCWFYWLTAHALINGCFVYWATNSVAAGLAETINHWVIDFAKCENKLTPHEDQAMHIITKIVIAIIILF